MKTASFELKTIDDNSLAAFCWQPLSISVQGAIVLVHGLGEHVGRYKEIAQFLTSRGCAVYGMDLRGHGRSPGKRGHADYNLLLKDLSELVQYVQRQHPGLPIMLYGHSMGGNIAINYLLEMPGAAEKLQEVILSSPWLRLNIPVSPVVVQLCRFTEKIYPSFTQSNKLNADWLSKDPAAVKAYREDPLVHDKISASLFYQVHRYGKRALLKAAEISLPLLVMHGTEDAITSCHTSKELAEKAPQSQWKPWEGLRHEPHHEVEKREVMHFVWEWMSKHLHEKLSPNL